MTKNADTPEMGMHGMSQDDDAKPAKTGQQRLTKHAPCVTRFDVRETVFAFRFSTDMR
jgi:hypothetical protein